MTTTEAIILGIVEGITEFLPVSSTGHMIISSSLMGIVNESFTKAFTVAIQFGAILAVIALYWKRFFKTVDFYYKLLIAFLPAAIMGLLFNKLIDRMLGNVYVVGASLLLGGIILLFVDKWFKHSEEEPDKEISKRTALTVGLFQVVSMIPGVSRSAATIIGGLTRNLNRKTAAEFSFFLAVPTMFGATCLKLFYYFKEEGGLHPGDIKLLVIGNVIAFVVALLAIKTFITFLTKHGFKLFGYYRIAVGLLIIFMAYEGFKIQMV
jgi:undecaprenyl-diphosphatase